jgi:acyl-CoA synthetase (AMP-forming)/AMP-acid ligase II
VHESTVYGVAVPGNEGRCGMAALVVERERFDPSGFYEHVATALPAYAQPRFVRLVEQLATTGTFKHKKSELVAQGFDPAEVDDPLFVLDLRARSYVPLGPEQHAAIRAGSWPL